MQEMTMDEVEQVEGGIISKWCDDIKNADFIGAYESAINFMSYVFERMSLPY